MALRSSKIPSEIINLTCKNFFSNTTEAAKNYVAHKDVKTSSLRYKISNLGKPEGLPELNFNNEQTTLFADLQPSAKPEFRFECNQPKWAEKPTDNSPFPASIKQNGRLNSTYSDQQKAEDKMLKYKMSYFNTATRHYSTWRARQYSSHRGPADNTGSSECKQKLNKCVKAKPKNCKLLNKNCPKYKLLDCEPSTGSNCKLNYLDPNCTKKFAPYPSYSESCAETLPDDPSECQQCPWRTCDGADSIEPGKPVRNKRNFSTSCSRHLEATGGVVTTPASYIPTSVNDVKQYICSKDKCGQSKQPCKQPLGPCEVRRQKEEEMKREKEIRIPSKPKKASQDADRMVLNGAGLVGEAVTVPNQLESLNFTLNQDIDNKSSWIDIFDGEEMLLEKKKKHPNCHKKKKPKKPDEGDFDDDLSIEFGRPEWWKGRGKKTVVYREINDCPCTKCPDVAIKSKEEVTRKTWKKKNKTGDHVHNKTTPFQYRKGR